MVIGDVTIYADLIGGILHASTLSENPPGALEALRSLSGPNLVWALALLTLMTLIRRLPAIIHALTMRDIGKHYGRVFDKIDIETASDAEKALMRGYETNLLLGYLEDNPARKQELLREMMLERPLAQKVEDTA